MADAKQTKTSDRRLAGAAAAAVEKKLKEGAKTMVGGVGESRMHGGHENANPPKDLSGYTCQGLPIPPELWEAFPISLTDQGKAEVADVRKDLARDLPQVYAGRDRTEYNRVYSDDKKVDKFRDDRQAPDTEGLIIVNDPLQSLLQRHTPVGHRGMFMSARKCQQEGMVRGVLEYKPVMVPGDDGVLARVLCGGMFLASVPEDLAAKSDRYWRQINEDKKVHAIEKVREQVDQVLSDRKLGGLAARRGMSDALVGMEVEDQERGDADMLREALAHE